ncbi:MAG: hypothetical protein WBV22_11700 [Anaerolineaceae bacterium]
MNKSRYFNRILALVWIAVFLTGCGAQVSTPIPMPPINPLPPAPPSSLPPLTGEENLVRLIRTVEVTPDDQFTNNAFARVHFVPATGNLVVTFAGVFSQQSGGCQDRGHAYKEYTLDMVPTGKSGILNCEMADAASVMVENTLYDVSMHAKEGTVGWRIMKYDAMTWELQTDLYFPLEDYPYAKDGDPMIAYVNGLLDVSSMYNESETFPAIDEGSGTHHHFFSGDLTLQNERILEDVSHTNGTSLIFVDGIYYFLSASGYSGDIILMTYDKDWNYLGIKKLIQQGHFPTGVAFDGSRFYLAYTDTSQRTEPGFFPVYLNVHLAVFDRDWNLLQDIAVSDYPASEKKLLTRAWILLHGDKLYVSYDEEGSTGEKVAGFVPGKTFVSIYEILPGTP